MEAFEKMRNLAFAELVVLFGLAFFSIDLFFQKEQLQQQLAEVQQQLQSQTGKPINIADLPDGSWNVFDDAHYAIVKRDSDGKIIAVHSCTKVPKHFLVAKGDVAEFPKNNSATKLQTDWENIFPKIPGP
jgi:hypothetical protein